MAIKRLRLAQRRKALGYSQERLAEHLGVDRSTVVRWESGSAEPQPSLRMKLAHSLQVSLSQLADLLCGSEVAAVSESVSGDHSRANIPHDPTETDDMNRREMLRLVSMASTLIAASGAPGPLDLERLDHVAKDPGRLDQATLDEYAALNAHLWQAFTLSRNKRAAFSLVQGQLEVLVAALQEARRSAVHHSVCELASDLFQLAGEIHFDGNQYTSAAHCYTLAAQAAKGAGALDLWACALTRHAFISVYDQRFDRAAPMLQLAAGLAQGGDYALSTRHWVSAVQAEVFAGLGDLTACERALDQANEVHALSGSYQNGGWLRFDGSRLPEERGTCYVALKRPELAETALNDALGQTLSSRRRGGVLVDLAALGLLRRDLDQLLVHSSAALNTARQTDSGVVARRLEGLQPHLVPHLKDPRVCQLNEEISAVAGKSAHNH
ncbi:helix-turn-helix transcriptional regulator [Kribbella sp. NPDC056345]|uniref:helix-turn-helix transcriptional regulator n=1 Tax=Kribbella sp. NPDC056345 TaxID=3345789 RepID=UPI0035DB8064